jgi:hypothetical protein
MLGGTSRHFLILQKAILGLCVTMFLMVVLYYLAHAAVVGQGIPVTLLRNENPPCTVRVVDKSLQNWSSVVLKF